MPEHVTDLNDLRLLTVGEVREVWPSPPSIGPSTGGSWTLSVSVGPAESDGVTWSPSWTPTGPATTKPHKQNPPGRAGGSITHPIAKSQQDIEFRLPLMSDPEWSTANARLGISYRLWHRAHAPSREAFLSLGLKIWGRRSTAQGCSASARLRGWRLTWREPDDIVSQLWRPPSLNPLPSKGEAHMSMLMACWPLHDHAGGAG